MLGAIFSSLRLNRILAVLTVLAVSAGAASSLDHNHDLCQGFVPENDMKIPVGWSSMSGEEEGLSEEEFNLVLDRIERIYSPVITQFGGKLRVNRKWTDPTVNASAQQFGPTWVLNMYGGLARHPDITVEGFALVACHELGHHIGGAPKIEGWMGTDWATNEGGADYFATLKCLRTFFSEDDNAAIVNNSEIDPYARQVCEEQFKDSEERLYCMRNSLAAQSVAGLFMTLRKETVVPRFDTPDKKTVYQTDNRHPATQCRMDTYFSGAVCPANVKIPVSQTDYREGSCFLPTSTYGLRPRCWFKPPN